MEPKLSSLVTWDKGTPPTKSSDTSITWSRDNQKRCISTFTRSMAPKTW